jgi:hypothetical protein
MDGLMLQKIELFFSSKSTWIHVASTFWVGCYFWILSVLGWEPYLITYLPPCALGLATLQIFHSRKVPKNKRGLWIFTSSFLIYITSMVAIFVPIYVIFRFSESLPFYSFLLEGLAFCGLITVLITGFVGLIQVGLELIKKKKYWWRYLFYCHVLSPTLSIGGVTLGCFFRGSFANLHIPFGIIFGLTYSILTQRAIENCLIDD